MRRRRRVDHGRNAAGSRDAQDEGGIRELRKVRISLALYVYLPSLPCWG